MDTRKIVEALEDLRVKRSAIDQAIASLESALSVLAPGAVQADLPLGAMALAYHRTGPSKTNIEIAIDVLRASGQMHIEQLASQVSSLAGHTVSRASLDGGISREIRSSNGASRFERVSPGVYRLKIESEQAEQH